MTAEQWDSLFFSEFITDNRAVEEIDHLVKIYHEFGAERVRQEIVGKPSK